MFRILRRQFQIPSWLGILLLWLASSAFLGVLTALAPVSHRDSDPRPALLVSQAIWQEGTVQLDTYEGRLAEPLGDDYRIFENSGHYYYLYPLGSSVFALPFVMVANLLGLDMTIDADDSMVQLFIGTLTLGLSYTLLYLISRCYLNRISSLVITTFFVLGSSIISTMGTALWSINFAVIFILLSLWLIVRADSGRSAEPNPYVLGALLFAAYFSRPSAAVFVVVTLLYLFWQYRIVFWRTAAMALSMFLLFLLANWLQFGSPLPEYQANAILVGIYAKYATALYGLLFSPSRGLFVYSPMFLLVLFGALLALRRSQRNHLLLFCVVWIGLQIIQFSLFAYWWGGYSYGPRYFTEVVPAFALMAILLWRESSSQIWARRRTFAAGLFLALGLVAIFFHAVQGLYNTYAQRWNATPDVDSHPETVLDWRYPQFAATSEMLCQRNAEFAADQLKKGNLELSSYEWGELITYNAAEGIAHFEGWSAPEDGFRWSECYSAYIFFRATFVRSDRPYRLTVRAGSFGPQEIHVMVNGELIGHMDFPEHTDARYHPATLDLPFAGGQMQSGEVNELSFHIPGATKPSNGDRRRLGLSLVSARIAQQ